MSSNRDNQGIRRSSLMTRGGKIVQASKAVNGNRLARIAYVIHKDRQLAIDNVNWQSHCGA